MVEATGVRVTVEGVGAWITANVPREAAAAARRTFKCKGGGQMFALFVRMPSVWFKVAEVRASLRLQGVIVSRETVRTALNHLVEMRFLELGQKMVDPEKVSPTPGRYRRLLNPAQREKMEGKLPVVASAPLAKAMREKRRRVNARRAGDDRGQS